MYETCKCRTTGAGHGRQLLPHGSKLLYDAMCVVFSRSGIKDTMWPQCHTATTSCWWSLSHCHTAPALVTTTCHDCSKHPTRSWWLWASSATASSAPHITSLMRHVIRGISCRPAGPFLLLARVHGSIVVCTKKPGPTTQTKLEVNFSSRHCCIVDQTSAYCGRPAPHCSPILTLFRAGWRHCMPR